MKYISVIATLLLLPSVSPAFQSPDSGDSSLVLHIWSDLDNYQNDPPAAQNDPYGGYVIDTGVNFSDVVSDLSGATDVVVDLNAIMDANSDNTTLADAFDTLYGSDTNGKAYFSLVAMDGQTTTGAIAGDRAILTTISGSTPASGTNVQLNNSVSSANTYFGFISGSGVEYNTASAGTVSNGTAHALSDYWGANFGGSWSAMVNYATIDTGVAVADVSTVTPQYTYDFSGASQSLNMALYSTGGSGGNGEAVTNYYSDLGLSLGQATLDFAAGTLTITPTQVPVPAAVWLFGSAILGLVGFSRRSAQQASA